MLSSQRSFAQIAMPSLSQLFIEAYSLSEKINGRRDLPDAIRVSDVTETLAFLHEALPKIEDNTATPYHIREVVEDSLRHYVAWASQYFGDHGPIYHTPEHWDSHIEEFRVVSNLVRRAKAMMLSLDEERTTQRYLEGRSGYSSEFLQSGITAALAQVKDAAEAASSLVSEEVRRVEEVSRSGQRVISEHENEAKRLLTDMRTLAQKHTAESQASVFESYAKTDTNLAMAWLVIAIVVAIGELAFLWFAIWKESDASFSLRQFTSKALLVSLLTTILVGAFRMHSRLTHNAIVNRHRAGAIASLLAFQADKLGPEVQTAMLIQTAGAVFAHQPTGLGGDEKSDGQNLVAATVEALKGVSSALKAPSVPKA